MRAAFILAASLVWIGVAEARPARCLLVVEGNTYIDGACEFTPDKDQFIVSTPAAVKNSYFAIVNTKAGEQSHWNEEAGANHAHTPLGVLQRKGACWENRTAKVCAWN